MTLEDISEPATNAYYEKYGGKYHNSARYTEEYRIAANALGGETATGADVKEYYYTEMNFLGVDPSGMRKSDRYEYDAAKSISTAGFDEKALALKEEVFAGYTVDSDITNERDAIGAVCVLYEIFRSADGIRGNRKSYPRGLGPKRISDRKR